MKEKSYVAIENITLEDYSTHADQFWTGTKDHDVKQNYHAFLSALSTEKPLQILDFGCGPGRDLKYFSSLGHTVTGLDGCARFCAMAREYSGCEVLEQSFLSLDLGKENFHGIFANASLFHVPSAELPRVLNELSLALKHCGIMFMSNPRGEFEGWNGKRYGNYMEMNTLQKYLVGAGFSILSHYYRPENKPRSEQNWLAVVSKKC